MSAVVSAILNVVLGHQIHLRPSGSEQKCGSYMYFSEPEGLQTLLTLLCKVFIVLLLHSIQFDLKPEKNYFILFFFGTIG